MLRTALLFTALLRLASCSPISHPSSHASWELLPRNVADDPTAKEWVVILDNDKTNKTVDQLLEQMDMTRADVKHIYDNQFYKGFAGVLSTNCSSHLAAMVETRHVEEELKFQIAETQTNAPWGLQRVSQEGQIAVGRNTDVAGLTFTYNFAANTGEGVDVYVIDTGVNFEHVDFAGRASMAFSFDGDLSTTTDGVGHGTHCSGTIASNTFGVAKSANILGIKVLGSDGSGSTSDILKGIEFMLDRHASRLNDAGFRGSVASMSLGGTSRSRALDAAVISANEQIHFSIAAGNEATNACNGSPAGVTDGAVGGVNALVVGAIDITDTAADFSNFGQCVVVYAPGVDITSTWVQENFDRNAVINTISGTSMATPHVAGLIASFLSANPDLQTDTKGLRDLVVQTALSGKISGIRQNTGDDGLLANNGFSDGTGAKMAKRELEKTPTFVDARSLASYSSRNAVERLLPKRGLVLSEKKQKKASKKRAVKRQERKRQPIQPDSVEERAPDGLTSYPF